MGALPSRESHQQGLHSYRHGRKHRTEVFLVPLTRDFFPSPDCPLFMSLFHARQRRTAKYYFRSPRPTTASKDSDYYCQTTAVDAPEAFDAYCQRRQADAQAGHPDPVTATPSLPSDAPMKEHDYRYEAYADTPEGLYHVLVTESELAMVDTDAELRERYFQELQQANAVLGRPLRPQGGSPWPCTPSMEDAAAAERMAQGYNTSGFLSAVRYYRGRAGHTLTREDQCHATAHPCRCPPCMRLRRRHRRRHQQSMRRGVRASFDGATSAHALFPTSRPSLRGTPLQRLWLQRVIAPTAHNIRPIPCAVVSRCDEKKAEEDVVDFDGMPVKVVGMFGLLPTTHRARAGVVTGECDVDGRRSHSPAASMTDGAADECRLYDDDDDDDDGDCCGEWEGMSDDMEEADEGATGVTVNHHLLKAGMFVDKNEGDQMIGQVVLLAANMYLRQCIQARIKPRFLPMLPFMLRFPLTNQPMLQLVREFRVRLRSLLDAGTAVSGERPVFSGINGFAGDAAQKPHNPARQRQQEEGYLYEDDIPYVSCAADLLDAGEVSRTPSGSSLSNHSFQPSPTTRMYCSGLSNTNTKGTIPIYLNSGVSRLRGYIRHPGLHDTGSTCSSPTLVGAPSTTSSASATARLLRRKSRFRMWVEDGHLCLWASAAYTRRACLLLAQQVGTKVTCDAVPEPRQWNYVGLLHGGGVVPAPQRADDVLVVAEDIPVGDLWQGDVLRCSTAAETASVMFGSSIGGCVGESPSPRRCSQNAGGVKGPSKLEVAAAAPFLPLKMEAAPVADALCGGSAASTPRSAPAPPGAFWVRGSGGLDDSRTNTSEATPLEKAEWKKTPSLAATGDAACAAPAVPAAKVPPVDRRLGTLNLEEVLLSWVKRIAGLKREVDEMDDEWVRDPDGQCVHVDRYVLRRLEHDGVRYFLGITPRVLSECLRDAGSLNEGVAYSGDGAADGISGGADAGLTMPLQFSFSSLFGSAADDAEEDREANYVFLNPAANGAQVDPCVLEWITAKDI